jgi:hypothetical protein
LPAALILLRSIGDRPAAAYYYENFDTGEHQLVHTPAGDNQGAQWTQPLSLACPGDLSFSFSLAALADGSAGICYLDSATGQLRFLRHF